MFEAKTSIADVIFEWPTQQMQESLSEDVHLEMLDITRTDSTIIAGVQCKLSTGETSPLF